jgi:tetratricopeptide (TPR) repeat protein
MLRLTESGHLKPLSKYEKQVAELMKLVESGQCDAAMEAFEQFKKDYPQIVGPNPNDPNDKTDPKAFDAFVEAEMYLCKRKFARAVRSYDKFLDQYRQTSKFAEVAPDRQLYIAGKFLSGEKRRLLGIFKIRRYAEGVRIIDGIIDRERLDTPIGRKAAKMLAESYEKRGRFERAYNRWFDIYEEAYNCWSDAGFKLFKLEKRPTDPLRKELLLRQENALIRRKETLLRMARCKHISYRGPKYDTSTLIIARNHYEELITNRKKPYR